LTHQQQGVRELRAEPAERVDHRRVPVVAKPIGEKDDQPVARASDLEDGHLVVNFIDGGSHPLDGLVFAPADDPHVGIVVVDSDPRPAVKLEHRRLLRDDSACLAKPSGHGPGGRRIEIVPDIPGRL
jgi:hypothetical protein